MPGSSPKRGKFFSASELACKHCGVDKTSQALVDALDALREQAGRPVKLNSAYRCPEHNKRIGGSPNSQHVTGLAADVAIPRGLTLRALYEAALKVPAIKGIGLYPDELFLHVDVRPKQARWAMVGNKLVSIEEGLKKLDD